MDEEHKYVKIHVCQASYGDCLALEFDDKSKTPGIILDPNDDTKVHNQRMESKTRKVMMIDGGPGNYKIAGTKAKPILPLANMYAMLNELLPVGSPSVLDTLVITHDDADHINGVNQLFRTLADRKTKPKKINDEFRYRRGIEAVNKDLAPFGAVWYNSPTLLFKDPGAKGWFDNNMDDLKKAWPEIDDKMPECNAEFKTTSGIGPNVIGGVNNPKDPHMVKGIASRGRLRFEFLSPNTEQVQNLKNQFKDGRSGDHSDEEDEPEDKKGKGGSKKKKTEASKLEKKKAKKIEKYKGLPTVKGKAPLYNSKPVATALRLDAKEFKLLAMPIDKPPKDPSVKNQSSLVFVVSDGPHETSTFSAAFTGDGNATASFLPIWSGPPKRYTVMKIAHHGSQNNNTWKKSDAEARVSAQNLPHAYIPKSLGNWAAVPKSCKDNYQEGPSMFFLNILARKYIICSASTEGHRNPHLSTLAGIITRAIVRRDPAGPVDIFLTSQTLLEQIEGFMVHFGEIPDTMQDASEVWLHMHKKKHDDGRTKLFWDSSGHYYNIYILRPGCLGTIMVDPVENRPSPHLWQLFSPPDVFWIAYHRRHYSTDVLETIRELDVEKYGGHPRPKGGKKPEKKFKDKDGKEKKVDKKAGDKKSMSVEDNGAATFAMESLDFEDAPSTMAMEAETLAVSHDDSDGQLQKIAGQAVGPQGLLSPKTFARFDLKVSRLIFEGLRASQKTETKVLKGDAAFVDYLASRGWLLPEQVTAVQRQYMLHGRLKLGSLVSIFLHSRLQTAFFCLFPITIPNTIRFTLFPQDWMISGDLEFTISDPSKRMSTRRDFSEIKSLTFAVKPQVDILNMNPVWNIPFRLNETDFAYIRVQIVSEIQLVVHRPFELERRYMYGSFLGKLVSGLDASNVIVDFLWFPDTDVSVDYHVRFANDDFEAEGYRMRLKDLWSVFPAGISTVGALAASVLLPGKDSAVNIDELLGIQDCGFVVEKSCILAPDVYLKRIFGTKSFDNGQVFQPFGDLITIRPPTIGLQIENLFTVKPLKVFVRIHEKFSIKDVNVPIIFESRPTRGGDQTIYQLSYIAETSNEAVTLAQIINALSLGTVDFSDIPGLKDSLDAVKLLSFTLGWYGTPDNTPKTEKDSFSATPHFIELCIQLDDIKFVEDVVVVNNALLEIRLDRNADSDWDLSISTVAGITLGECPVELVIKYGERPEWLDVYEDIPGYFKLALNTTSARVLSLENVLGQFMPPGVDCLPTAFRTILTKTGIKKCRIGVQDDDEGNNFLSVLDIEIVLDVEDVDIFDGFNISRPTLHLRIERPGNHELRKIEAYISVMTEIADQEIAATIWLETGKDTRIGLSIVPTDEKIALGDIITSFQKKLSKSLDLDLPDHFTYFRGINTGPIYMSFRKPQDSGLTLDTFFLQVEANRDFILWDEPQVKFSNITFLANYVQNSGLHVAFGATLAVGSYQLVGVISYNRIANGHIDAPDPDGQSKQLTEKDPKDKDKNKDMSAYIVHLTFSGSLSLHDILLKATGVNVAHALSTAGLDSITKYTDISISSVDTILSKTPTLWTVNIGAKLSWLGFTSVSLEASRSNSWSFDLQLTSDSPLRVLPDSWADAIEEWVSFSNTWIYVFYGPPQSSARFQKLGINQRSQKLLGVGGGIAVATTLKLGPKLDLLREWLQVKELRIFGAAGSNFFSLGVRTEMLTLLGGNLRVRGGFFLAYVDGLLDIGVEGEFELDVPAISKTTIIGSVAAVIAPKTLGLGFEFGTTNGIQDVCQIKGFDLEKVKIQLMLSPQAGMMPTVLGVQGGIRIQDLNDVTGHIGVRFIANDPINCYIEGSIDHLNLPQLLGKFATAISLPDEVANFLGKNGVNLERLAIQVVPKDMMDVANSKLLKRRLCFEGAVSLVINGTAIWAGYTLIDIKASGFIIFALMEPVQLVNPEVFSLRRSTDPDMAKYTLELPQQVKAGYLTPHMLNEGPVLKIASEGPKPVFISAQLTLLGAKFALSAAVDGDSFHGRFAVAESSIGSLEFLVNCVFKSSIGLEARAGLNLGLHSIPLVGVLSALDGAFDAGVLNKGSSKTTVVGFSGELKIGVAWATGKDPLSISLSGKASAFDREWSLGEIGFKITENDLRSIKILAEQIWEYIRDTFTDLVKGWMRDAQTAVSDAIQFLKENWDLGKAEMVRLVAELRDTEVVKIIEPFIKELDMGYRDALDLVREFGFNLFTGTKFLEHIYGAAPAPDQRPSYLPDVPHDILDLPKPPVPGEIPGGTLIDDDLLHGLPGFPEKPTVKPTLPVVPVPVPPLVDPFKDLPDFNPSWSDIPVSFGAEPDAEAETSAQGNRVVAAKLPAWYANEIAQLFESAVMASDAIVNGVDAASTDRLIGEVATFREDEIIALMKSLRLAGYSEDVIRREHREAFGQETLPQVFVQV